MAIFNWETLLKSLSRKLIEGRTEYHTWVLTPEMQSSEWLGNLSASEEQIAAAEARLGTTFPPSYRAFLTVSNGWPTSDWTELELWSTEQVDWFSTRNRDWINAWRSYDNEDHVPDETYFVYGEEQDPVHLRREYLPNALEISSDSGDGDIFLLIPDVVFEDGEWEAWHFGNKLPGAFRYRSFYALMQKVLEQGAFVA